MDRRLVAVFVAGLLLGGAAAAWTVVQMTAADKPATPVLKTTGAVRGSAQSARGTPAAQAAFSHVPCPDKPLIVAASREDGLMRLKNEPTTAAEISALILTGKESAAAGRPRDAELTFLAACKAADQLHRADASEPTDARYQLARHYAHHVLVGNAPGASRAELTRRAELLYTDSVQAYRERNGAEHEKTRFATEGLAALRQSQPVAQAAPVKAAATPVFKPAAPRPAPVQVAAPAPVPGPAPAAAPKRIAAAEPKPPKPAATPIPTVAPARPAVAQAPRPQRAQRTPEPMVIEAPVRQATGTSSGRELDVR